MVKPGQRSRGALVTAFAAIAVVLVASQVVSHLQSRDIQRHVELIESNALASINLVQRMGLDVQRRRILIDRHIFEHEEDKMRELEAAISTVATEYAAAARAYSPLATFADEPTAWHQLTLDIAALEPHLTTAVDLSRSNRDVEARHVIAASEPLYDAVQRDVNALVAINQLATAQATAQVSDLQQRMLELRSVFGVAALMLTMVLGIRVVRTIGRREEEIERYGTVLENRNRELDAFAGRVAHDLRGPLATIKLSGSLLAERLPDEPRVVTMLERGLSQMEQLIDDLLTLSRFDGNPIAMVARTENVASTIADDLGPRVKNVGGTLSVDLRAAQVRCGEGLLRQVLWNLGENAVKYRRADVDLAVEMVGRPGHDDYEIRICDNGSGMSADVARAAFEPFFRGAETRSIPGTGLGLSIVRRIIEGCGGNVSLDTIAGRGTTVVIHVPFAA